MRRLTENKEIRMKKYIVAMLAALAVLASASAFAAGPAKVVVIETSMGKAMVMLDERAAPKTVENFLRYVNEGFYNGTIFHRVIRNKDMRIVQGGGFDFPMQEKMTHRPIEHEGASCLPNAKGTIAMARRSSADSATAQFFINMADNDSFNYKDDSAQGIGYCAFGRVIRGLNIFEQINQVSTAKAGLYDDVPKDPVFIKKMFVYGAQ